MSGGTISEGDIQIAIDCLRRALPAGFCRQYFQRDHLDRLERVVGRTIPDEYLLNVIVRQRGPQLLGERQRQIGRSVTSIRRALLEKLPDAELGGLYLSLLKYHAPADRVLAEKRLAGFSWRRGSASAQELARTLGLPSSFGGSKFQNPRATAYEIEPIGELPSLKPYQRGILREIRAQLSKTERAMVSSFTGTGKTRLGMEYAVDLLMADEGESLVLWVAQKVELLEQACDAIEQLWPWLGQKSGEPLQVIRYFAGSSFDSELAEQPTLVVASTQQLIARIQRGDGWVLSMLRRAGLMVVDEAHHALAAGHKFLIDSYESERGQLRKRTLGLTATPGRSNLVDPGESRRLAALFGHLLVVPHVAESGGALSWFQSEGYLSWIRHRNVKVASQVAQTLGKLKRADETDQSGYRDYTSKFLEVVGEDSVRNRGILRVLSDLHAAGRHMLVFCCNIAQAELLSQSLIVQGTAAGLIHYEIDARDRHHTIAQFRRGELKVLFNVEVLTTGFDAPKVDTIVMCRPTLSRVLYEQMVGRGMRGPLMGGTAWCEIVDFTTNFGRFQEPQAWEAFWEEWQKPQSENLEKVFTDLGWKVVGAQPEDLH